jgi:ATPase subunit of ABC transporter with duplicated ATPase domains
MRNLIAKGLSFAFENSPKPILNEFSFVLNPGWTGIIGANGAGKTTLLKILTGQLTASTGHITRPENAISVYCSQNTDEPPEQLDDFLLAFGQRANRLKAALDLFHVCEGMWATRSPGERKRLQLATALWTQPDLLLLDEPTNHLDQPNRQAIYKALAQYEGIGVVVSHDRELLNHLCQQCLFFKNDSHYAIPGNYDQAATQLAQTLTSQQEQAQQFRKQVAKLDKEINRLDQLDRSAKSRLSKRGLKADDHDAKAKIDGARITGKDASVSQRKKQLQNRTADLHKQIKDNQTAKEYARSVSFSSQRPKNRRIITLEPQQLPLPNGAVLDIPYLSLDAGEKGAITGANGSGKTTFLNHLIATQLKPSTRYQYLPQSLGEGLDTELLQSLQNLTRAEQSRCLQLVACLGSDAKAIRQSAKLSPGESRKLMIALAIVREIELLFLDEPTNHMDLPTIENLEQALGAADLSILLISHNPSFIRNVCHKVWHIAIKNPAHSELVVVSK